MTRSLELALLVTLLAVVGLVLGLLVGPRLSAAVPGRGLLQTTSMGVGR